MDKDNRLTIGEHLAELRGRLFASVIALVVTTTASFFFAPWVFHILKSRAGEVQLIRTQVTEMIGAYMKVSLIAGVVLAMPFILYQLIMFIAPALTSQEKRYLYILLPAALLSFLGGATFAYFILLPPALHFLLSFGKDIAQPLIKVGDYVNVVVSLTFWIGLIFETPLVIFFLARIGVVNSAMLSRFRRYMIVVAFLLSAIITPTFDPVNQTIVAVPIIVLYELGIWLAKLAQARRRKVMRPLPQPAHD
ncbi:MAG: twin-arginine translocase subunit TatC [Chloroflexi bacterium]|nr:twin-arginine translocase subunit TatC [Chloroflexota bacterium]